MESQNNIVLFNFEGKIDNKNILNRAEKKVSTSILNQIENGITLELLDQITKDLPIFKYRTQITIHGIFDDLGYNYCFGYKSIFQNKNKSIGVKYGAIDEEKRQYLRSKLSYLDFFYRRNSNENVFIITKRSFDAENVKKDVEYLKNILMKIDTNLFLGGARMLQGNYMGATYTELHLEINAIYQKNIKTLLDGMGITEEFLLQKQIEENKKKLEREEKDKLERQKEEIQRQLNKQQQQPSLDILETQYKKVVKVSDDGIYITPKFNYDDEFIFKTTYIYTIKGKNKPRWQYKEFGNLDEALSYEFTQHYGDNIFNGTITGFKIK